MKNLFLTFFTLQLLCMTVRGQEDSGFNSVDVIIKSQQNNIGGTLVIPENPKSKLLVIMSSGSGPQDRDETLDGFKIFKTLAEQLANDGIPSFRYDDRGVGQSTGNFGQSTLTDLAVDLKRIIQFFKGSQTHNFSQFILLGHSQGGIVCANVAVSNPEVKKLILMGAPGVPLVDLVLSQLRDDLSSSNLKKSMIEEEVSAHNYLMRALKDGKQVDLALANFRKVSRKLLASSAQNNDQMNPIKIEEYVARKTDEFKIVYNLPSLSSFLYHDVCQDYQQLKIPVLSLMGGRDKMVPIYQNKDAMEDAFFKKGVKFEISIFEKANHYFQEAETGTRAEYKNLKPNFVDGFVSQISNWILGK